MRSLLYLSETHAPDGKYKEGFLKIDGNYHFFACRCRESIRAVWQKTVFCSKIWDELFNSQKNLFAQKIFSLENLDQRICKEMLFFKKLYFSRT